MRTVFGSGGSRMTPAVASALSLTLGVTLSVVTQPGAAHAATASPAVPGATGMGDTYFPQDGNGGIDVLSYRIRQRWQPTSRRLSGVTRLRVRTTSALSSFNLDFLLPASRVRINGRPVSHSRPQPHELKIVPRRALAAGREITVTVRYAGKPLAQRYRGESDAGMSWDGATLSAVNQPHIAPFWFPSNDHPTDRASMDVTTTVPKGMQVIGNGLLVAHTTGPATETWRWRNRQPMATYLAYFVAGKLELSRSKDRSGRPTWYAVSRTFSTTERRRLLKILRQTPAVTRWLEQRIGVGYPWKSNGGVMVPDLGFALETQGRPVYSSWADTSVVVHELAHQWFGDLITVRRWSDIWLNEGFATFYEWDWAQSHGGTTVAEKLRQRYDVRQGDSSYWQIAPAAPGAQYIFEQAVYERGAMTLAALQQRVGATTLRRIITTWVTAKAGRSASTAEFIAVAEEVSGQDLSGFFDAWLSARVKPAVTAQNGLA